jgi:hypothetical protein
MVRMATANIGQPEVIPVKTWGKRALLDGMVIA